MEEKKVKLTKKQHLFIKEYLIDLNATQAAIRAGYSKNTAQQIGSENLLKPLIAEHLQIAINERSKKTEITAEYVLNTIVETINRAKEMDANGRSDNSSVLKGCELLGKHLKLFTDKQEVEHSGNIAGLAPIIIAPYDDQETD